MNFLLVAYILGHGRVQTVQAVDQDDVIGPDAHRRDLVVALARLEIIVGDAHLLAGDEPHQVLVDQPQVQGLRGLKVIVAELVLGVQLQVKEIVVHVEGHQAQPRLGQPLAQLDRGRRLARRGRPGNDDQPDLVLRCCRISWAAVSMSSS